MLVLNHLHTVRGHSQCRPSQINERLPLLCFALLWVFLYFLLFYLAWKSCILIINNKKIIIFLSCTKLWNSSVQLKKKNQSGQVWWQTSAIPTLERLDCYKLQDCLGYTVRPFQVKKKNKNQQLYSSNTDYQHILFFPVPLIFLCFCKLLAWQKQSKKGNTTQLLSYLTFTIYCIPSHVELRHLSSHLDYC